MTYCPTCGRRHRPRRVSVPTAQLDLLTWVPPARPHRGTAPGPRLVLLHGCLDAEGEPRAGIIDPGRRVPRAFANMAAAVAELRRMEAGR
ncbi:hypothetical protein GCM10011504_40550 [Siccirubricoccus deserti]|uniref:Uncharacterized protein n=1 Tax=Siccirubricoccus deserti TaxID=2013562 RepID=A0A9X0UE41_9PROT|nr:hypothetical protein [Siccirubricoccus deserti]MBC4017319.1 hypothetical protein [Siccirubricoccus deserti]GGC58179.1 hypothetical protein GCM10011504_40550 [Siccirubricoccus deserti]